MIIVRLSGGMGNQMFQYALGRSLAIKNNTTLGLDVHDLLDRTPRKGFTFRGYDLDLFSIEAELVPQSMIPPRYRSWGSGKMSIYGNKLRRMILGGKGKERNFAYDPQKLSLKGNLYLDGYWQSYKYFESIADVIRSDFSIQKPLPEHIQILQDEIMSKNSVCLHVRRGDYVGNTLHEVVDNRYYENALKILNKKTIIDHLYVFSDDIAWCREYLHFDLPVTYVGNEYAGERGIGHFELMRTCRHFIIPNSSFSWWAAWLAQNPHKIVIAPHTWFNDLSVNTRDLIPPEWIQMQ